MSIEGQNWEPLPYLPLPGQCESLNCCAGVLTSWLSNTESFWVLIQVPEEQKWKKKNMKAQIPWQKKKQHRNKKMNERCSTEYTELSEVSKIYYCEYITKAATEY